MDTQALVTGLLAGTTSPTDCSDEQLVEVAAWAARNDKNKLIMQLISEMHARGLRNRYTRP